MTPRAQEVAQLDRLIHEPARLTIVLILDGVSEADFLYLQREGGFTQGNLSGHLAKLEEAGYVEIEKKFKGKVPLTVCRLTSAGSAAFSGYSQRMLGLLNPSTGAAVRICPRSRLTVQADKSAESPRAGRGDTPGSRSDLL